MKLQKTEKLSRHEKKVDFSRKHIFLKLINLKRSPQLIRGR